MSKTILLALLGDHPSAVTIAHDLLVREGVSVDEVVILIEHQQTLSEVGKIIFQEDRLGPFVSFVDVPQAIYTPGDVYALSQVVCDLLNTYQQQGNQVILSLASGNQGMALILGTFATHSTVMDVVEIRDEDEYWHFDPDTPRQDIPPRHQNLFPSIEDLYCLTPGDREQVLHPDYGVALVHVPFDAMSDEVTHADTGDDASTEKVLIAPLGTFPGVVTHAYALLTRSGYTINELMLVYPERSPGCEASNHIICQLFRSGYVDWRRKTPVSVSSAKVMGIKDIATTDDCRRFLGTLTDTIVSVRAAGKRPILVLGGGRKSMNALTYALAQQWGIPAYVALIGNRKLVFQVGQEMNQWALDNVSRETRNARLLLEAYDEALFHLFQIN